jgi:hypothetical protein
MVMDHRRRALARGVECLPLPGFHRLPFRSRPRGLTVPAASPLAVPPLLSGLAHVAPPLVRFSELAPASLSSARLASASPVGGRGEMGGFSAVGGGSGWRAASARMGDLVIMRENHAGIWGIRWAGWSHDVTSRCWRDTGGSSGNSVS